MTPRAAFEPAASWPHKADSEEKQERDFSNLLQQFGHAVQRQDGIMIKYCECELKRMFREKEAATRRMR